MKLSADHSVVLIFIDGLGIGDRGDSNPMSGHENELEPIAHFTREKPGGTYGGRLAVTDPRLGVEGRPQSASGQTTILTGINAPQLLGYHKQGFPNAALRKVIAEKSIFLQLQAGGIGPNTFANTYTPRFFLEPPRWKSATTCAVEAAGLQFHELPDLLDGRSLFHDFTNGHLRSLGYDVPDRSPAAAAEILSKLSQRHRFTLYEHFITDKMGHARDAESALTHLALLAEFIRETVDRVDLDRTTVILTSDHGNVEDLSVRTHTLNDVPTLIWGRRSEWAASRIRDLSSITPTIMRLLE